MRWHGLTVLPAALVAIALLALSQHASAASRHQSFECYVAAYAVRSGTRTLVNPVMRVGLYPSGSDPALHLYGRTLQIIPLTNIRISDRFIRANLPSETQSDRDIGKLILRQRGLRLEFQLSSDRRGATETGPHTVFIGECSSIGYERD